ncbi:MAG: M14 family metallopeptidase [Saprospiraceae bacterium]
MNFSIIPFVFLTIITYGQMNKKMLSIPFDENQNQTPTYAEIRDFYRNLDLTYDIVNTEDFGMTDSGHPLQIVVIDKDRMVSPKQIREAGKAILFINNGIHPGEPDGIDATMLLAREITEKNPAWLNKISLVIIPVYNIDGCINRSGTSRANQNGPEAYGFRANAKNLDLNRDFIKCDSKNALSFNEFFNLWDPDVMIDTHTSNGADYQYTMTLISTQKDKLHPLLGTFMSKKMLPSLYAKMDEKGWEMIPYVNTESIPDKGIYGFMDSPRYSSGYAALHHTISFMPETHMLKPYLDRVLSTKAFIESTIEFLDQNAKELLQIRKEVFNLVKTQDKFHLTYSLDKKKPDSLTFKGYTAAYKPSEVSHHDRLYYDRSKPWQKKIPYYDHFDPALTVTKPKAYLIPQAYDQVLRRLHLNGVKTETIKADTVFDVEVYKIEKYETTKTPYEGHYLHHQTEISVSKKKVQFYKGDYIIFTDQKANRYLVEVLEPQAPDSYFNWNFFDGILSQKEYFSDYVFEDLAAQILSDSPTIQAELDKKRTENQKFAQSAAQQLDFVYRSSPYFEPTHMVYPVMRLY